MKRLTAFALIFIAALSASAASITSDQAKKAVGTWVRSRPAAHMTATFGANVGEVETISEGDTNLFHVVTLEGGGFVVTSTDDRIQPVIAFSDDGVVEQDDRNPLWVMLKRDLAERMGSVGGLSLAQASAASSGTATSRAAAQAAAVSAWADLLDEDDSLPPPNVLSVSAGRSSVTDVRVAQLVQSKWNQSKVGSENCYNYYTPYDSDLKCNLVCGCVATAGAQLMRYWRYPTASVSARTYTCAVFDDSESYTMQGGTYDWSSMDLVPTSALSDAHRKAIGKLCYDVGVACQMGWGGYNSKGAKINSSGAGPHALARALVEAFAYRNAMTFSTSGSTSISSDQMKKLLFANFDAGCPVLLGISGNGGHEIVADGYGMYSGNCYTHLNLGWGGSSDAWYNLPEIGTAYNFSIVNCVVYNVFKDQTGELLTGRVLDASGNPISGCTVSAGGTSTTSDAKGIYALHVAGGKTYSVEASAAGYASSAKSVFVPKAVSDRVASYGPGYSSWYLNTATAGNSWGNDFALSQEARSADLQIKKCLLSNVCTTQSAVAPVTTFQRGESIYAYIVVGNDGDATTDEAVWVTHEISPASSEPASTMVASSLAAGETAALTALELPMLQGLGVGSHTYTITVDGNKTASVAFNVEEPAAALQSVVVNGASSVAAGLSETYACRATLTDGTVVTAEPVWTIDSGSAYASIDQDGVLHAENTEVARSVVIRATCIYNGVSKSGTKTVSIVPSISLNAALDNAGLVFETDSAHPWFGQSEESYDGVDAAQSASIGANSSAWFKTTVTGSGTLSFWYKVSSEENYDKLVISCDGADMDAFSGECAWSQYTIEFAGTGEHTVCWSYVKDVSRVAGSDAAWVDRVVWTATVTPVSLSIEGATSVLAGECTSLAAVARMSDGTDMNVTSGADWSLVSGDDYASISAEGILTAFASTLDHEVTVRAEYTRGAVTKSAEKTIRVVGVLPEPGPPVITRAVGDGAGVTIEWAAADYAETYSVLRWRHGADEQTIATALTDLVYRDEKGTPGVSYSYRVVAMNKSGMSSSESEEAHRLVGLLADASALTFESYGGAKDVTFKANAPVAVSVEQDGGWLSYVNLDGDSVSLVADKNDNTAARMATVTLTAGGDVDYPKVVTLGVIQQGATAPTSLPDLAFSNVGDGEVPFFATSAENGDPVTLLDAGKLLYVRYGWINQGAGTAKGCITNVVSLRTTADEELFSMRQGFDDIKLELKAGYSCAVSDEGWKSLPAGVYKAHGFLDYDNVLEESDKDNNNAQFRFALRDPVSLQEALDCEASVLEFETLDEQWYGTKGVGFDGEDCAMTKLLGDGGTNTLSATLTGAGKLSFKYRVSTEARYDVFRFLLDGDVKVHDSGEGEWNTVSFEVEAGEHAFNWIYGKDAANAAGDDCVYLDQVVWTPVRSGEPPSGFAATDGSYYSYVKLTWTDIADAKSYVVERAESSEGPWTVVVSGDTSSPAYDETGLGGVEYLYRIKAVYADGESDWSTSDSGWCKVDMQSCSSRTVSGVGGTDAISKKANCIWRATVNCNWLTFDSVCGTNDFKLVYRFPYNDTGAERSCKVTITGSPDTTHPSTKTFTVTQRVPADNGMVIGLNEATGCSLNFSNSSDAPWFGQTRIMHNGKHAMRSAEISGNATSRVEVALSRTGTLTFWWGTSSESSDILSCLVGGVQKAKLSGYSTSSTSKTNVCNWAQVSLEIPQGGAVVAWQYVKDSSYDRGLDAGYVSEIVWTPATEELVPPQVWFDKYPGLLTALGTNDLAAAAKLQSPGSSAKKTDASGNPWLVWMDYVCGTDPLDSDSKFTATITMVEGVPKIEWSPKLSEDETKLRNYLISGKRKLDETSWTPVAEGHEGEFNFFRVSVEMQ